MDLKIMFDDLFVVTKDESWDAETPESRTEFRAGGKEKWYWEIRGKYGLIYPSSETFIAVCLTPRKARELEKVLGSELVQTQRGDDAVTYMTDLRNIEPVLLLIKPKRRRQLTEAHKTILTERLAANRYRRGQIITQNDVSQTKETPILSETLFNPLEASTLFEGHH